jgi:FeoB-associated Cys-rich membrane protein
VQNILTILIVAAAAAYLARAAWSRLYGQKGGACGSCPSCSSNDSIKSRPLVTISMDLSHAKPQSRQE